MIGNQLKDYEIISLLGEGGMANVYLGKHVVLGNLVAIKLLKDDYVQHPNIRKRFLAEARNLAKMSHPNIIRVTDLIDAGDIVAFAMDYIEGTTLDAYLLDKGKLTDAEIEGFMKQMISAVDYVHAQGLIHRDMKPSNFMISVKGEVKLLDFGIAKNTNEGAADYTKTGMAQQMGTPLYMSPEQVRSASDITKQTDIYSLGVVLWQMVMNKKPYDSEAFSLPEIQVSILKEALPSTGTVWDPIIQGATVKNPADRTLDLSKKGTPIEHIEVSVKKPFLIPTRIGYAFAILLFLGLIVFSIKPKSEDKKTSESFVTVPDNKEVTQYSDHLDSSAMAEQPLPIVNENVEESPKVIDEKKSRGYYYDLGKGYQSQGKHKEAVEQFSKEISGYPGNYNAYFNRALSLSNIGKRKEAINDYMFIVKNENKVVNPVFIMGTVYNNIGYCYLEIGDFRNSEFYLNKAIDIAPDEYYIWDSRGELYYNQKKYTKCISDMTKALQVYNRGVSKASSSSNMGHVYYYRGVSYIMERYMDKGCEDLHQAEQLGYKKAVDAIVLFCL